jgi:DNA invertase Pin-like site-specific DNA recombinase
LPWWRSLWSSASASIVSCDEAGNGDSDAQRLVRRVLDAVAENERAAIRARTRAALRVKRDRGERVSRHAPIGFRHERGRLVPEEAEGKAVTFARELRERGVKIDAIVAELNERHRAAARGARWHYATVYKMVSQSNRDEVTGIAL